MFRVFYFLFVTFCFFVFSSCAKDSLSDLEVVSKEDAQLAEEWNTLNVINAFCEPVEVDDSIVGYQLKFGKILDESNPKVYSVACDSLSEVHNILHSYFYPLFDENPDYLPVYDLKSGGKITYCEGKDGNFAQLKIDMPLLPKVKEINFMHRSDWPENDADGSPYGVGDVVVNNDNTLYYICVRECMGGMPGLLLGCEIPPRKKETGYGTHDFELPYNYAKVEVFNALAHLYFNYPNKLCQALETIYYCIKSNMNCVSQWWGTDQDLSLYFTANANNRDYYYDIPFLNDKELPEEVNKTNIDRFINRALEDNKAVKYPLCAEGYSTHYKYYLYVDPFIGIASIDCDCTKGEYYVYSINKEMKDGIPVFKYEKTISWNRNTPIIYDGECYFFTQKTFTESDTNYRVINLTD